MYDADLVIVLWSNAHSENGRPFETLTRPHSSIPLAWQESFLQNKFSSLLPSVYTVFSDDDLRSWMSPPLAGTVTREHPLLVPIHIARSVLGWHDFDVWKPEDFR